MRRGWLLVAAAAGLAALPAPATRAASHGGPIATPAFTPFQGVQPFGTPQQVPANTLCCGSARTAAPAPPQQVSAALPKPVKFHPDRETVAGVVVLRGTVSHLP